MRQRSSDWAKIALFVAGVFHVLWGALSLVYPSFVFSITAAAHPQHMIFWQLLGVYSAVMGVGYFCAASNPAQHWPVVLMGLLVDLALPVGYLASYLRGDLPASFGWVVLLHDLIWVLPFAWILRETYELRLGRLRHNSPEIQKIALRAKTTEQISLFEMTHRWPTMVVFLRHFGCMFCREAVADLARQREEIGRTGTRLVFVHMGTEQEAREFFSKYGLEDIPRVSDPECAIYRAFGLTKGNLGQIFGLAIWPRAFEASVKEKHGVGLFVGDGFQMPGVFLMFHGEVLNSYRHQNISDRPNYVAMLEPTFIDESAAQLS